MSYDVEKDWAAHGLRCVVIKTHGSAAHRCGYVAIGKEHPLFGVDYPTVRAELKFADVASGPVGKRGVIPLMCHGADAQTTGMCSPELYFDVHGGITYSGEGGKYPAAGTDGEWWYGFDAGHCDDNEPGGRSLEYMAAECESLAEQLQKIGGNNGKT